MDQISQCINSKIHKIYSCDQIRKVVVNLVSKKGHKNDDSYTKLEFIINDYC